MVLKEFLIKCAEEWERLNAPISGFAGMFKVTTRLWNLLQDQWQYQNLGYLQGSNAAAHSVKCILRNDSFSRALPTLALTFIP